MPQMGWRCDDADLGLRLSECDWLGRRVWLAGRLWKPPQERTVFFSVVWWDQEAHHRLEGAVVPSGWLRRGFWVGDQYYGADLVGRLGGKPPA